MWDFIDSIGVHYIMIVGSVAMLIIADIKIKKIKMTKQEFLECIIGYLPYGLECEIINEKDQDKQIGKAIGIYNDGSIVFGNIVESDKGFHEVKPLLRPTSQIPKKVISDFNFVNFTSIKAENIGKYSFEFVNWCYKNHYDIHDLITKGLATEKK